MTQHRPKPVQPNAQAYDPNHYGMGITTGSHLSHSDRILCPRPSHKRLGQQGRDPEEQATHDGIATLPRMMTSPLLPEETDAP